MKNNRKNYIAFFTANFFYILCAGFSVALAFLLQRIVDSANTGDVNVLLYYIGILLALWAVEYIVNLLANMFRIKYIQEMLLQAKQHRLFYIFFNRKKPAFEDDNRNISFFTTDADILADSYYNPRVRMVLHIAEFVFAMAALIWINWIITVSVIAVTLLPIFVTGFFSSGLSKRKKAYSEAAEVYVDTVRECIEGKKEIIAYDKQDTFLDRHTAENRKLELARAKSNLFQVIANNTSNSLGFLTFVTALGLGTYFVMQGTMTFGYMIAMVQLMNALMNPVEGISRSINDIRSAKEIVEKAGETVEPVNSDAEISIQDFKDTIKVNDLGLSYQNDTHIFQGLNLAFKRGGKYAINAPSGYGKTSLARAIASEFTEYDGNICLDGVDIKNIGLKDYHNLVRYVRQDPYLFNDTALNNLTFFSPNPDKETLEKVLAITRVSEFLPDEAALLRPISNNTGLSGGQKQRLVLARALLHRPKVLILDEITSGIDIETARNILNDLFIDKDLTCIAITHESDESFIELFDEVIYLAGNEN